MGALSSIWNWATTPVQLEALKSPSLINPAIWDREQAINQNLEMTGIGSTTGYTQPLTSPISTQITTLLFLGALGYFAYKVILR